MNSYSSSEQIKSGLLLPPLKSNILSWLQGAFCIPCWTHEFGKSRSAEELPMQRHGGVVWDPLMENDTEGGTFMENLCWCYGNSSPAGEKEAD